MASSHLQPPSLTALEVNSCKSILTELLLPVVGTSGLPSNTHIITCMFWKQVWKTLRGNLVHSILAVWTSMCQIAALILEGFLGDPCSTHRHPWTIDPRQRLIPIHTFPICCLSTYTASWIRSRWKPVRVPQEAHHLMEVQEQEQPG